MFTDQINMVLSVDQWSTKTIYKDDPEWINIYELLKNILSTKENIKNK